MSAVVRRSGGLTIGTVLTVLKSEFPGISISKIRFLETEGLIEPERAPSGYRLFSSDDVDRLRLILRAQRDAYLPLRVISEKLRDGTLSGVLAQDDEDTGDGTGTGTGPRLRAVADPAEEEDSPGTLPIDQLPDEPVTEKQLATLTGLSPDVLSRIRQSELISVDKLGRYTPEAVAICRAAGTLMRHGIDERHWGPFRVVASRESGVVEQAVSTRTDPVERLRAVDELVDAMTELHRWLLSGSLRGR